MCLDMLGDEVTVGKQEYLLLSRRGANKYAADTHGARCISDVRC